MNGQNKKEMNFEINLLPVISLLAVCISFLLLTTVWIHIGTMNVSQGMGDAQEEEQKNPPSVWATLSDNGEIRFTLKDAENPPAHLKDVTVRNTGSEADWESVDSYAAAVKESLPDLKTVLIMPSEASSYESLIQLMDRFKKNEIREIGIAPL